jgi:hypothetical protein
LAFTLHKQYPLPIFSLHQNMSHVGAVVSLVVWYLPNYQVRQFAIYYLLNNENCPLGKWSWNISEIRRLEFFFFLTLCG